jgi:heat shock protein HtpX
MVMDIYHEESTNTWKTWMLMSVFLVVIIALGWLFSQIYDSNGILIFSILLSLAMNITGYWFSDKIALKSAGAREITKEQFPVYWNVVENLSITAGLPMPKLYVIDDPVPNAFATGRNKEHAAIAATSGLLGMMNRTELEGVFAHELSHIGNKDILLSTVVVVLAGSIAMLSNIFLRTGGLFGGRRNRDGEGSGIFAIVGIVAAIIAPIAATLIQLSISRKREYLADASGALLTRYPEGLASALEKIERYGSQLKHANTATAHLYISNPFGSRAELQSFVTRLFSTHPPIEDRIRILRGVEKMPE